MQTPTPATPELSLWSTASDSADLPPVALPPGPRLRALLAVAEPSDLSALDLAPADVSGEVERVRSALDAIPATVLPAPCSGERATLAAITAALRDDLAICWLVGHSQMVRGEPCLWLEQPDGVGTPVPATVLAAQLARPARAPRLVVLSPYADDDGPTTAGGAPLELGLHLAQGGIPAVLALQGPLCGATVEALMAAFFRELRRDGQIGRALAVARGAVPGRPDQGWPALFLRDADGRIWREPARLP
ncbi:MAG: CHAT domain-containing protein [Chloroflexales bacterium]|nr:CHAT domain-containing protein [Chloroflexales bacterium]